MIHLVSRDGPAHSEDWNPEDTATAPPTQPPTREPLPSAEELVEAAHGCVAEVLERDQHISRTARSELELAEQFLTRALRAVRL